MRYTIWDKAGKVVGETDDYRIVNVNGQEILVANGKQISDWSAIGHVGKPHNYNDASTNQGK